MEEISSEPNHGGFHFEMLCLVMLRDSRSHVECAG
jgi:hypothetical protein